VAAQFLRLKLRLLGNSFARQGWQLAAVILGLFYGLTAAVIGAVGFGALRLLDADQAGVYATLGGALITLLFLVVPLITGVDDAMDPRKFSLLGVRTGRLATGLGVAALVSVPSVIIIVVAIAQIGTWSRDPLAALYAVIGAVLIVITCVLASRVTTSLASFALSSRRARDSAIGVVLLVVLALSPALVVLSTIDWRRHGAGVLETIASAASWTPLGAVWAAPADAASGRTGEALAKLVIAVAFAAVLVAAWRLLVGAMMVTSHREVQAKAYHGLGWFSAFPSTAAGAIAARTLTYWRRDARYHVSLLVIPVVPLLMIVPLLIAGVPAGVVALVPVPVIALFLGWSIHNDVAYDNTALWLHVASDVSGTSDRLGRAIPALFVGVPVVVIGSLITAQVYGDGAILPSVLGVSLCILLSGLGLSSAMSARFPYPVVRPGDSPFSQPQASGNGAALIQGASFLATFVVSLPTLAFAALGLLHGSPWHGWSLVFGAGLGLLVFVFGIRWGGDIFDRRTPELLAFSMRN